VKQTALKPARKKPCKVCQEKFTPPNTLARTCSIKCAIIDGESAKKESIKTEKKENRKAKKEFKEKHKTRSEWAKEAQAAVNSYIRARDAGKPCISCDKPDNGQHQRHASHYRSVGACSSLRFNTFNIHASCATCNSVLSGNLLEYRIRLIKKLGADRVDWLECQNELVRYDIEYLARLKKVFNKRARREVYRFNKKHGL